MNFNLDFNSRNYKELFKFDSTESYPDQNLIKAFQYFYKKKLNEDFSKNHYFNIMLEKKLNRNKPKLIISNLSVDEGYFISEYGKKNNIKSILIPHGSHVLHTNKSISFSWRQCSKYIMSNNFDKIVVQSPLMNDFIAKNNYLKKQLLHSDQYLSSPWLKLMIII